MVIVSPDVVVVVVRVASLLVVDVFILFPVVSKSIIPDDFVFVYNYFIYLRTLFVRMLPDVFLHSVYPRNKVSYLNSDVIVVRLL